ncbi:MAG: ABC transporter ATP-binding protein [Dehalococcoidia bacterium]|nr:ABC transporter ATP-binding protein [Dehalococcoidia bacterium]
MLKLNNIEAVYSDVVLALTGVSMQVTDGNVVVLLGNNGSGKSTTLKSISGVLDTEDGELTEGSIELDGKRIDKMKPETIARLGVCHVVQGRPVFPQLTTEENLLMGAYMRKDNGVKADMAQVYEYFPKLVPLRKQKSGYLSGGEQQMLVIGRAFLTRPRIMLLDEPSLGLAPMMVAEMFTILKKINREQKTAFLIAEQNAAAALSIADYGYLLQNGKVALEGTAPVLKEHQGVKKSYLGVTAGQSYYQMKSSELRGQNQS